MTARRPLTRGDVVLIPFPFTDLSGEKVWPAVIVERIVDEDLLLAFVTSRVSQIDAWTDVLLGPNQPEFSLTGLRVSSTVRLNKLTTLHRTLALRRIGFLGPQTLGSVMTALHYVFEF